MIPFQGWLGEIKTSLHLWLNLDARTYKRIHNIIIPGRDGTTQIDHLIISPYGLFIIETKNLKGWIFGSYNQRRWTQVIFGYKYYFQNPIHQTYRQMKTLAKYLEINELLINTVIYFNGSCRFKTPFPSNVINGRLSRYIKSFQEQVLSDNEIEFIQQTLDKLKFDSSFTTKDHIKSLRERYSSTVICPKCGSKLVERMATKGYGRNSKFLGCTKYPNCRYTRNI